MQRVNRDMRTKLVSPVFDQTRWTGNDAFLYCWPTGMWRLLHQSPKKGNTLQSLAKTHFICHDTTILVFHNHTSGAFVEELHNHETITERDEGYLTYLDTLNLVGTKHFG